MLDIANRPYRGYQYIHSVVYRDTRIYFSQRYFHVLYDIFVFVFLKSVFYKSFTLFNLYLTIY